MSGNRHTLRGENRDLSVEANVPQHRWLAPGVQEALGKAPNSPASCTQSLFLTATMWSFPITWLQTSPPASANGVICTKK